MQPGLCLAHFSNILPPFLCRCGPIHQHISFCHCLYTSSKRATRPLRLFFLPQIALLRSSLLCYLTRHFDLAEEKSQAKTQPLLLPRPPYRRSGSGRLWHWRAEITLSSCLHGRSCSVAYHLPTRLSRIFTKFQPQRILHPIRLTDREAGSCSRL